MSRGARLFLGPRHKELPSFEVPVVLAGHCGLLLAKTSEAGHPHPEGVGRTRAAFNPEAFVDPPTGQRWSRFSLVPRRFEKDLGPLRDGAAIHTRTRAQQVKPRGLPAHPGERRYPRSAEDV
jgi:hypothetical protein